MGISLCILSKSPQIIMFLAFILVLVAVAAAEECGIPDVKGIRVIAGKTAVRGSWPWQVLMLFNGQPGCGGTLIAPQWVVTAAHCVYGRERYPYYFSVVLGEHDRYTGEGSEQNIRVSKVYRYPSYDPRHLNNDIAMFKLSRPAKLGKYVKTACLPSQDPPVGTKCYITGWGKTHHPGSMTRMLQQGLLPVVSNKACYKKNNVFIPIPITSAMICVVMAVSVVCLAVMEIQVAHTYVTSVVDGNSMDPSVMVHQCAVPPRHTLCSPGQIISRNGSKLP